MLAALGLITIALLWVIKPTVEPTQHALYHWSGTPAALFGATALDMFLAWSGVALLLLLARRGGRGRVAIWTALLLFLPWFIEQDTEILLSWRSHNHVARAIFLGACLATLLLPLFWKSTFEQRFGSAFERIVSVALVVFLYAGIFGIFLLCRLAWYSWQASRLADKHPLHHAQTAAPPQPHRVIWIVLDELSYEQIYVHRYPGLDLPAFDKLAAGGTAFTHVVPLGTYTEIVLPGLLSGKRFDMIRTSSSGELSVHNEDTHLWSVFNAHDTVFQDALDAGYSTGVAGWFNPYCQVDSQVLDHCMWTHGLPILNGMEPSGTLWANTLQPAKLLALKAIYCVPHRLQAILAPRLHLESDLIKEDRLHISDYQSLNTASDKLLRDRSVGFVFLHMPVPHGEGIYNRKTGAFTTGGSTYIDNLALADKCLAGLRKILEDTGQWNSSTVVVMGDHSWRTTQLWEGDMTWTPEEQAASQGGLYDPRPAYLVKLPGQTTASTVDTPYHAVNTRKLLDGILNHSIGTPEQLKSWAQTAR